MVHKRGKQNLQLLEMTGHGRHNYTYSVILFVTLVSRSKSCGQSHTTTAHIFATEVTCFPAVFFISLLLFDRAQVFFRTFN